MSQLIRLDADKGKADNYGSHFFAQPIRFSDAKYFSKCFKASRGLSPSEYRTAEKGEESAPHRCKNCCFGEFELFFPSI